MTYPKIKTSIISILSCLSIMSAPILLPTVVFAQPATKATSQLAPDQIVSNIYTALTNKVNSDPQIAKNPSKVVSTIEEDIYPYIDTEYVAKKLIGKPWSTATESQRKELISETKKMLVRQYQGIFPSLVEFLKDSKLDIKKARFVEGDKQTVVKTTFTRNNKPLELNYKFRLNEANQWKFIDVGLAGPWLTDILKDSIREVIEKQGGIDGAIKMLKERNNKAIGSEEKQRLEKVNNALK